MTYQYNPYKYTEDKQINGVIFNMDPSVVLPLPDDHEDSGRTLQQVHGWSDSEVEALILEEKWTQVRKYRNEALKECDWVAGEDVPQAVKDAYFPYRQSLRDITDGADPDNLTWPTKPE